jgi:hypothetical protein
VKRYVALRDAGRDAAERERRAWLIDPFLAKIEELVDTSNGQIRADVVHARLRRVGFAGTDRTTRRVVAEAKNAYRDGHRRRYRPWLPSRAIGCSSTGARSRRSLVGGLSCFVRGCRGRGIGWCYRRRISSYPP